MRSLGLLALLWLCTSCSAGRAQPITLRLLVGPDRQVLPMLLIANQWQGADATFVQLTVWRFTGSGAQPALQLQLDDWCGRPIVWTVTPDNTIVLPAADATARRDPENPAKCLAQPARRYHWQANRFVVTEP